MAGFLYYWLILLRLILLHSLNQSNLLRIALRLRAWQADRMQLRVVKQNHSSVVNDRAFRHQHWKAAFMHYIVPQTGSENFVQILYNGIGDSANLLSIRVFRCEVTFDSGLRHDLKDFKFSVSESLEFFLYNICTNYDNLLTISWFLFLYYEIVCYILWRKTSKGGQTNWK